MVVVGAFFYQIRLKPTVVVVVFVISHHPKFSQKSIPFPNFSGLKIGRIQMWLLSSLAGHSIVVQALRASSHDNFGIKLVTLHEFVELMDTNQKTEKCDDGKDTVKNDKQEPGIEFVKGVAGEAKAGNKVSTTTNHNLLPTIHNPVNAPFFNSYRNVFQGWKNSVPKLYKYSPSDIEVVVYRKNGQVDKLKKAAGSASSDANKPVPNTEDNSSAIHMEKSAATSVSSGEENISENSDPVAEPESESVQETVVGLQACEDVRDIPTEEVQREFVREIASETVTGTLEQALIATGLDNNANSRENGIALFNKSDDDDIGVAVEPEPDFAKDQKPKSVELRENGNDPPEFLGSMGCCHVKFNTKHPTPYSEVLDIGVTKALLDVATQATAQMVKVVESAVQNVPPTREASSQWTNETTQFVSSAVQTECVKTTEEKFTETDPIPEMRDFGCQKLPTGVIASSQTESPKLTNSYCQSFRALISEATQTTRNNVHLMDSFTQTYIDRTIGTSQTDPDILRHRSLNKACQFSPETACATCQVEENIEQQDAAVQCVPDQNSKAVQLSAVCCRIMAKRIKMKYEAKLRILLKAIEASGKKEIGSAAKVTSNGAGSAEEEYTPEMIREMIATFKQRQKETDELHEELKRTVELLTEQVSISKSLDSHEEYIEDDWLEDNAPTSSA